MSDAKLMPVVQQALDNARIIYKVMECDPDAADTAAFCQKYKLDPGQAANTIIVMSRKVDPTKYAVCVVLAPHRLDVNKKVCQLMGVKKASFADGETTQKLTGMQIGGVVAFGIKDLPVYVDSAVLEQKEVVMGGGNLSSKTLLDPKELTKLPNIQIIDQLARAIV